MKIVITGASGFIGKNLVQYLELSGYNPVVISRSDIYANNVSSLIEKINDSFAVINLSGSSISKRWTRKNKREIYYSRIHSTRMIIDVIRLCENRPKMLINASAVGIYDAAHRHDEESKYLAYDYLGKVVRDWEYVAQTALEYGVSVSTLRLGIVLGKNGGVFKKLKPFFKFGLGGRLGKGNQFFSFIHIDDLLQIIHLILLNKLPFGTYNIVAPEENTNSEFTKKLAEIYKVPAFINIPRFLLFLIFGEGARVFTNGQNVTPARLLENGYVFKFPTLISALKDLKNK